jgi:O-antigen/teichoic acid export membrane protein
MNEGRGFARSGVLVFAGTTGGQVAQLLLITLVAHRTSVSELGLLLAVIAVLNVLVDVVDFGGATRMVREGAAGRFEASDVSAYFTGKSVTGLAAAAAAALAGALIQGTIGTALLLLSPWVALRVASQARRALLQMTAQFGAMALAQLIDRAASALVGGLLLLQGTGAATALGVGYGVGSLSALVFAHVVDRSQPVLDRHAVLAPWRSFAGSKSFGVTLVITDLVSLDLVLLTWVAGAYQAGLFALASRLAIPVTTMASSMAVVALTSLAAQPSDRAAWNLLKAGTRGAVLLSAGVLTLGIVFAPQALHLLGGAKYVDGSLPLRMVLGGCVLSLLSQLMLAFLQSRGHEGFAARVLVPSIALSLAGAAGGGAIAGASGAGVGYLMANLVILIAFAVRVRALIRR